MEQSNLINVAMDNYKGVVIKDMSLIADTEEAFEA
jgi:hypothetical protein